MPRDDFEGEQGQQRMNTEQQDDELERDRTPSDDRMDDRDHAHDHDHREGTGEDEDTRHLQKAEEAKEEGGAADVVTGDDPDPYESQGDNPSVEANRGEGRE